MLFVAFDFMYSIEHPRWIFILLWCNCMTKMLKIHNANIRVDVYCTFYPFISFPTFWVWEQLARVPSFTFLGVRSSNRMVTLKTFLCVIYQIGWCPFLKWKGTIFQKNIPAIEKKMFKRMCILLDVYLYINNRSR